MRRELSERRVLITGASRGIGRAAAEELAGEGARLLLVARTEEKLNEAAEVLRAKGAEVVTLVADVTSEEDRKRMLEVAVERFGGLDVLVNNAGIASWAHFANSNEEIMRKVMETNFFAPAELIRSAIPILVKGQQPAVVNVGSMCGRRGMPAWPEYSAAKFALTGLTEALRGELARFDIDILIVQPGLTRTGLQSNMLKNEGKAKIDFDKGMPAEQVGAEIVRCLKSNVSEKVIGREARSILRFNKFFPRWLDNILNRRVKKLYEQKA